MGKYESANVGGHTQRRTPRVEWYAAPSGVLSVTMCERVSPGTLTLNAVVDFGEPSLVCELHFVREHVAGARGPVDKEVVVSGHPLRADVGVYLHTV